MQGDAEVAGVGLGSAQLEPPLVVGLFECAVGADDGGVGAGSTGPREELETGVMGVATRMVEPQGAVQEWGLDHHDPSRPLTAEVERGPIEDPARP